MADKIKAEAFSTGARAHVLVSSRLQSKWPMNSWKQIGNLVNGGNARRASFYLVPRQSALWMLSLSLVVAAAPRLAQSGNAVPPLQAIVERMAQARAENRARYRPYVVKRTYKLFGREQYKIKSQVLAEMTFAPPNIKNYSIEESVGAGLGERAVRRILQSEAEAAKNYSATDFSPDNYDFKYLYDEHDVSRQHRFVLELLPKRQEKILLRGKIWVDATTYLIHRFEGEPAKSSSWWVRDVQMVLLYSDVDGMWLQTSTEATARVRILGPHRLISNDEQYEISSVVETESPVLADQSHVANALPEHPELAVGRSDLSPRKEY